MKNFKDFDEFCHQLYDELGEEDKVETDTVTEDTVGDLIASIHNSYGRGLRNEFHLWDTETDIVKWFEKTFGITHADDISSLIIVGIVFRNDHETRDRIMAKDVQRYKEHWKIYGK